MAVHCVPFKNNTTDLTNDVFDVNRGCFCTLIVIIYIYIFTN